MSFPYLSDFINYFLGTTWSIPVATFGTFVALAILLATHIAKLEVRRFEQKGLLSCSKNHSGNCVAVHQMVSDLAFVTALAGLVGARLFHILEYPHEFIENPWTMIFSSSGMSIYGGLLMGFAAGVFYLKKRGVPLLPVMDAIAPALVLGYGIGRLGCQLSGDGDWGTVADMALKPEFLPDWLWAQTYENNVLGIVIAEPGVYPTPIYESTAAFVTFGLLWLFRKSHYVKGMIFSAYLILSGFSRLLVEKIRVNSEYHVSSFAFTQAELISVVIILLGLFGIIKASRSPFPFKLFFSFLVVGTLSACAQL